MHRLTIVAVAIALGGCGTPTSTVAPSATATTTLTGSVANGIAGPIAGAIVAIAGGPSDAVTTTTAADGSFRLSYIYSPNSQLRVTKPDYAPLAIAAPHGGSIGIDLHLATPPANLGGGYVVTFTADTACTQIPDALRSRSYSAVLQQASTFPQNTVFDVTLSGGVFARAQQQIAGTLDSFFGFVEANAVDFRILNRSEASEVAEGIREEVAPHVLLEIQGDAKMIVHDPSAMSGPMSGSFTITDSGGARTCASANHALTLRSNR